MPRPFSDIVTSGPGIGIARPGPPGPPGVTGFQAGNDLSGTTTSQTVVGIQGRAVDATAPATGEAIVWGGSQWAPGSAAGAPPTVSSLTAVASLQTGSYGLLPGSDITLSNVASGSRVLVMTMISVGNASSATDVTAQVYWDIGAGLVPFYFSGSVEVPLSTMVQFAVWTRSPALGSTLASLPLEIRAVSGLSDTQVVEGTMAVFVLPP